MKKNVYIILSAFAVLLFSCGKAVEAPYYSEPSEIILQVEDENALQGSVDTRTTAITSIPGALYWGATTGSGGSQSAKWSSTYAYLSGSSIYTGRFQTASPTAYNYYVSNAGIAVGSDPYIWATNDMDVIAGCTMGTSSTTPSVTLNHVFARTGSITVTTTNGSFSPAAYSIVSYGESGGTAGNYTIRTGGWSSVTRLSSATGFNGSSDLYLVPGSYVINVTGTYTRGDYSWYGTKSGVVTLTGGKINNISLAWPDMGTEIVVSVSLTGWSSQTVNGSVS